MYELTQIELCLACSIISRWKEVVSLRSGYFLLVGLTCRSGWSFHICCVERVKLYRSVLKPRNSAPFTEFAKTSFTHPSVIIRQTLALLSTVLSSSLCLSIQRHQFHSQSLTTATDHKQDGGSRLFLIVVGCGCQGGPSRTESVPTHPPLLDEGPPPGLGSPAGFRVPTDTSLRWASLAYALRIVSVPVLKRLGNTWQRGTLYKHRTDMPALA